MRSSYLYNYTKGNRLRSNSIFKNNEFWSIEMMQVNTCKYIQDVLDIISIPLFLNDAGQTDIWLNFRSASRHLILVKDIEYAVSETLIVAKWGIGQPITNFGLFCVNFRLKARAKSWMNVFSPTNYLLNNRKHWAIGFCLVESLEGLHCIQNHGEGNGKSIDYLSQENMGICEDPCFPYVQKEQIRKRNFIRRQKGSRCA